MPTSSARSAASPQRCKRRLPLHAPWRQVSDDARLARVDWLEAARSLPRASVDLLYADPPFATGSQRSGSAGDFDDRWPSLGAYLDWLRERLAASIPLLKPAGSILLHVDWRTCHHARLILDELVGVKGFVNHLVWSYGLGGSSPRRFARKHDDILYYSLDPARCFFDPPRVPATSRRMNGSAKKATDVLAIPALNNMARERVGYPTQKPLALLDLLIRACCPPRGVVFDPCCGSGTTAVAAVGAGRAALACDISAEAIAITAQRVAQVSSHTAATNDGSRNAPSPLGGEGG